MREEYLAGLDPYLRLLPTRLEHHVPPRAAGEEAARLAMQQPAASGRRGLHGRRRAQARRRPAPRAGPATGRHTEEQLGLYVEPVQLQVVCRRLWEKLPADATQIGEEDVEAVGDVDSALAGYYAERVAAIAGQTGVRERAIREWFDGQSDHRAGDPRPGAAGP